ncbi:hypothetical protein LCGC14_2088830 [marine sediment metagenome]|uniref:MCM C-terminal domain-containing protein n=1 Tax=marine sediment metagenome TaxID=412755 RepID=A0A0F9GRJ1_9ZZZZ
MNELDNLKEAFGKKKKEIVIYTSLHINEENKTIAEQVYDGKESKFCIYASNQEETITYSDEINEGVIYKPHFGEEIRKKAILLPTKPEEYGTDEELDKEIKDFINEWLDVPPDVLQFAVWNIKRSWVYERFHTLNYLRALGDTGQGKSRFLDTLGYIHYKPIATSGASTAAPVFRIIDKWHGTLIMDEADFQKSDEAQDIIKIINQGYEKGRYVMRCDKEKKNRVNFFDPFCPKILATRKAFEDKAVESRCITQVMVGTYRRDINWNLNDRFWEQTQTLRNKLLMWRFRNYFKIDPDKKIDLDLDELEPRVQQIVASFISLFGDNEKQLQQFKKFILNYQGELIEERRDSFAGMVVNGIHKLIEIGKEDISAKDIIEEEQITNKKGHLISSRGLSSTLKSLGFGKTKQKRSDGNNKRCIPLNPKHLIHLFKRYAYDVTVVTVVTEQRKIKEEAVQGESGGNRMHRYNRYTDTHNSKDITKNILEIINHLSNKLDTIPIENILQTTQKAHIPNEKVEEAIEYLKREGLIYEPRCGFLKKL